MYAGVPIAVLPVTPIDVVASVTARATPKSVTSAWRPASITLSGLMSRCTMPCAWACASASHTSRRTSTTSATGSGPSCSRRSRSERPASYGMT